MSGLASLLSIVIWWGSVIGAAVVAGRKRRRAWPYVLVAIFAPLIGFLAVVIAPDRSGGGRWLGGDRDAAMDDPGEAYRQEIIALSHWTGVRSGTIARELKERRITTREWAAEHDVDTSKWRTGP